MNAEAKAVRYSDVFDIGNIEVEDLRSEAERLQFIADMLDDPKLDYSPEPDGVFVETLDAETAEKYGFVDMWTGDEDEDPQPTPWVEAAEKARLAKIEQEKAEIAERLRAAGIEPSEWAVGVARDMRPDSPEVTQAKQVLAEATKASATLAQKIVAVIHPERPAPATTLEAAYANLVAAKGEADAKQIRAAVENVARGDVAVQVDLLNRAAQ
jgi:hypothetical protein